MLGEFSRQPLILGLFSKVVHMFCLHRALRKIHMWKLFDCGKIKSGRRKKKKKKTGPKKREKVSFCQEKKKNNL